MATVLAHSAESFTAKTNSTIPPSVRRSVGLLGGQFSISCQTDLPVHFIELQALWVRGALGPITIWVTPDTWHDKHNRKSQWSKVYEMVRLAAPPSAPPTPRHHRPQLP